MMRIPLTDINIGTGLDGDHGAVDLEDDAVDFLAALRVSTAPERRR